MATIYNYHPQTGEFVSSSLADESPLEPGVIIVPAYATPIVPPAVGSHQIAVFANGSWSVQADWRGVTLYSTVDGSAVDISGIGVTPLDVAATDCARPGPAYSWVGSAWALDSDLVSAQLATDRSSRWEEIKSARDDRTVTGGYKAGDHWYDSDLKSRVQQQDNESVGTDLVPVEWRAMDGTMVTMTAELAAQIRVARMENDRAIFAAAEIHRAAMEASADPASYDFSGGWPKTFSEK